MATDPFLGELMLFAGKSAPPNWAPCEGQQLSNQENVALFAVIGTTYGGVGVNTFALPDLRGKGPVSAGGAAPANYWIALAGVFPAPG